MGNPLASSIKAGVAYAVTVFAIGFLLGTARVLLLAPRVGSTVAVLVETPVILAASWYVAGLRSPAGAIGFAAQVCFATFPLLNVFVSRPFAPARSHW